MLRHIDGTLYVHPRTGQYTLKLARADYNLGSLMVLDATNILALESFSRPAESELINQVTVRYRGRAAPTRMRRSPCMTSRHWNWPVVSCPR